MNTHDVRENTFSRWSMHPSMFWVGSKRLGNHVKSEEKTWVSWWQQPPRTYQNQSTPLFHSSPLFVGDLPSIFPCHATLKFYKPLRFSSQDRAASKPALFFFFVFFFFLEGIQIVACMKENGSMHVPDFLSSGCWHSFLLYYNIIKQSKQFVNQSTNCRMLEASGVK